MREFQRDPYPLFSELVSESGLDEKRIPKLAFQQLHRLLVIIKNEGITLYCSRSNLEEWRTGYLYTPEEPAIDVARNQAWPNFRWCLTVALGMHFTRGAFLSEVTTELYCEERWRAKAEAWATNYLASTAGSIQPSFSLYPDNSRTNEAITRNGPAFEKKNEEGEGYGRRRDARNSLCKGYRSDGKQCRGFRTPGTAFCQNHQDQGSSLPTLADIVRGFSR